MITLTIRDEDAIRLDGFVTEEAQKMVDLAKLRLSAKAAYPKIEHAWFIGDLVNEANTAKVLSFLHEGIRFCELCKARGTYAKYTRDSKYHWKGQDNHDRPIHLRGIEFRKSSVRVRNQVSLGCCVDCWKSIQPAAQEVLGMMEAEIPEQITGEKPRFKRHRIMKCECGWEGIEDQMGPLPALLGGTYKGKCPSCEAENRFLNSNVIKGTGEYTIRPAHGN